MIYSYEICEFGPDNRFTIYNTKNKHSLTVTSVSKNIFIVDIKASDDLIIFPGEAKYIDTGIEIVSNNKISIVSETPTDLIFNTKLNIKSNTIFVSDLTPLSSFKFIVFNNETLVTYPIKGPNDKPTIVLENSIMDTKGGRVQTPGSLNPVGSYFVASGDVIARLIITKLEE